MTTLATSTVVSMANTTALRALGTEVNTWFGAIGLVQTADTGQINWTTVTLPAAATIIGYEIWRFADSSIYFKLEWRTNSGQTNSPIFFLTVGTGSDGAGAITGVILASTNIINANFGFSGAGSTPRASYLCHTADFLGVALKIGSGTGATALGAMLAFSIEKMTDSVGTPSGTGVVVRWGPTPGITVATNLQAIRTAAPAADYGVSNAFSVVPANLTSTLVGADRQVFLHAFPSPRVIFSPFMCTVVNAELPIATTFSAILLGVTSRTYIALGNAFGCGNSASPTTTWSNAMLWE